MIESAIYAALLADAGVFALVSANTSPISARVYPLMIPEHVYAEATKLPCIVYTKTGVDRQQTLNGTDSVVRAAFQIDSYARTHSGAISLAAEVRDALLDYAGTVAGVEIKHAALETEFSLIDPEPGLFRVTQSWSIWHVE